MIKNLEKRTLENFKKFHNWKIYHKILKKLTTKSSTADFKRFSIIKTQFMDNKSSKARSLNFEEFIGLNLKSAINEFRGIL